MGLYVHGSVLFFGKHMNILEIIASNKLSCSYQNQCPILKYLFQSNNFYKTSCDSKSINVSINFSDIKCLYNVILYIVVPYNIVPCDATSYSTEQYRTVPHNTLQLEIQYPHLFPSPKSSSSTVPTL